MVRYIVENHNQPPLQLTPNSGLLEKVEGDYIQSLPPPSNDWHYVTISRLPSSGGAENSFTWKNKAGVEWELTFIGEERSGVLKFKVGENKQTNKQTDKTNKQTN